MHLVSAFISIFLYLEKKNVHYTYQYQEVLYFFFDRSTTELLPADRQWLRDATDNDVEIN